jgi:hypothetical protein
MREKFELFGFVERKTSHMKGQMLNTASGTDNVEQ